MPANSKTVILILHGLLGTILWVGLSALTLQAQELTVTPSVSALTIHPGDVGVPLRVNVGGSGVSGPVTVTLTGLPSGVSVTPLTTVPGGAGSIEINASLHADQESFPPTALGVVSSTSTVTVQAVSGIVTATAPLSLIVSLSNPSFTPASNARNIPIVSINTSGVQVIDKSTSVPGIVTITSADGSIQFLPGTAGSDNTATFKVHGNSTQLMPKLPYKINLNTSTDLLSFMGLSCGYVTSTGKATCDKSTNYILLANYDDKTMLRDWAASALALAIPHGSPYLSIPAGSPTPSGTTALQWWAPHSLYVDVYLNGVYEGVYQLIEEVGVDSHKVNINKMAQTDMSGKSLTGGYLLEIDEAYRDEDFTFETPNGVYLGMIAPDFTPETTEQTSYIQTYIDNADIALFGASYRSPTLGWRAYFDQTSLVDYYIVQEAMGNSDGGAFAASDYVYKDKNNILLYMGPVWDFDLSSGNVYNTGIVDPTVSWITSLAPWYKQLMTDPSFKAAAAQEFNALKNNGVFARWLSSIQSQASALQMAQINNYSRWPMIGETVWPNPFAQGSYQLEVGALINWVNVRLGYMDAYLNNKQATTTLLQNPLTTLQSGTNSTLTAQVNGGSSPTGTATLLQNHVVMAVAPVGSDGTATFTLNNLPSGTLALQAVYNGDTNNALSVSSTVQATVLPGPNGTVAPVLMPVALVFIDSALDAAGQTSTVSQASSLLVTGWAASYRDNAPAISVQVFVDGVLFGTATPNIARPDVYTYSGNSKWLNSGYTIAGSAAGLSVGPHVVTAQMTDSEGNAPVVARATITVVSTPPVAKSVVYVEQAIDAAGLTSTVSQASSLFVSGWAVSVVDNGPATSVRILVDGAPFGAATLGVARPDIAAYFNNQSWLNTGYTFTGAAALSVGTHLVTAQATDSLGNVTVSTPRTITVVASQANMPVVHAEQAIDPVSLTSTVSQASSLFVSGWAVSVVDNGPAASVRILVDGAPFGAATLGVARPDIAAYFNNQSWLNTGYTFTGAARLSVGTHLVTAQATDSLGNVTVSTPRTITVVASQANMPVVHAEQAIDPVSLTSTVSQASSLFVSGWAASVVDNGPAASVRILVDGAPFGAATLGVARPDVAAYFNNQSWLNTGYTFTGAARLSVGTHLVTAQATDSLGNVTVSTPRTITVVASQANMPVVHAEQAIDPVSLTSTVSQASSLFVSGWAASVVDNGPAASVRILVDGAPFGAATLGVARPDVAAYFNNQSWLNTGYTFTGAARLSVGTHLVTAQATDSLGNVTVSTPRTITVVASQANMPVVHAEQAIDPVSLTSTVSQASSLFVSGWAVSVVDNGPATSVRILVDGAP